MFMQAIINELKKKKTQNKEGLVLKKNFGIRERYFRINYRKKVNKFSKDIIEIVKEQSNFK